MANDPIPAEVMQYLDSLVPPRSGELAAMEERARASGFPIVGPASGYCCYMLARMLGARRVFELGSGYGYSTAWFARAVQENGGGEVHHVVWDEQLSRDARGYLGALGYGDLVRYHVGEAVAALREAEGPFDLIFNDIDKRGYPASLPVIESKLRSGGILIIDNMFLHGGVFDERNQSPDVQGVREFTERITRDAGWIASLLPIRDGLIVAYKR